MTMPNRQHHYCWDRLRRCLLWLRPLPFRLARDLRGLYHGLARELGQLPQAGEGQAHHQQEARKRAAMRQGPFHRSCLVSRRPTQCQVVAGQ